MGKLGRITVETSKLLGYLQFPAGYSIERVEGGEKQFTVVLRGGDMPLIHEGQEIPYVKCSVKRQPSKVWTFDSAPRSLDSLDARLARTPQENE